MIARDISKQGWKIFIATLNLLMGNSMVTDMPKIDGPSSLWGIYVMEKQY
jgi:hypothetical protein